MPTTTTLYPAADVSHAGQVDAPLAVDGSGYIEPALLGVDVAAYQGGDSASGALQGSALVLPEIDAVAGNGGDIDLVYASHWLLGSVYSGFYYPTGNDIVFTTVADYVEDDLIEVEVETHSTVAGAPSEPTCSDDGPDLTWNVRFFAPCDQDYRPQVTKFYAAVGAAGIPAGTDITVAIAGSQYQRSGQIRVFRGVDPSAPYDLTWSAGQFVTGYSYPDAPAITVATDGATVVWSAGGDVNSAGYAIPVVPLGYQEILNAAKVNPSFRLPVVAAMLQGASPGSYDPPPSTGLDYASEYATVDVLRPAPTSDIPVLVLMAVSDDTATAEMADGDVAISAANEVQLVRSFAGSGTRTFTFAGQTTSSISDTASAATFQAALEALSNIDPGDVLVTGGPLGSAPIRVEFDATYALTDVAAMTVSGTNTNPVNEVQAIQSDLATGTFPLTFGGQTVSGLPFSLTAAQAKSALQSLSTIGLNNVEVTGGPLPGSSLLVEFVGSLSGADQAAISSTESDVEVTTITGGVPGAGMVVDTVVIGSAADDFTLVDSFNIPRGGPYEPQWHLFSHLVSGYQAGQAVDIEVADHDGLHSWAAVLMVLDPSKVDPSDVIDAIGSEVSAGSGSNAAYGTVTPATPGAVIIAALAKAKAGTQFSGVPSGGSAPPGYAPEAEALGGAMTMAAFSGPPVADAASSPGSSSWPGGDQAWSTVLIALKPIVGSASTGDLFAVIDDESTEDWIDIASAAGSMFEIVEVDLDSLPPDAVLTGARIEFAHACAVANQLRVALVGIDDSGGVHLAAEQQVGYQPSAGGGVTTEQTNYWTSMADGTSLNDYARLGIALISSARHTAVANHRVYWARLTVRYEEGGPVISNVAGPTDEGDPITWDYSSAGGFAQTYFEVVVLQGAAQDPDAATVPDDPLAPATGELVYDSGLVPGTLTRSLSIGTAPLSRGSCTVAVRAWASITSSLLVASEWATADFDISGAPPATPDQAGNAIAYNPGTGAVDVTVTAPAGVSRAWLARSIDAGSTWELADGGPFVVAPSGDTGLSDIFTPAGETVAYAVSFDNGPMSETGTPDQIGAVGVDTTPQDWLLIIPSNPDLSAAIEVAAVAERDPVFSVTAQDAGGAVVVTSPVLGHEISMTVRTRSKAQRQALLTVLGSGATMRVVSYLGDSWLMRRRGDAEARMQRWRDPADERLRDAYEISFELVEVTR